MSSTWMVVVVVGVGMAALGGGLWWALADFVLDRLGAPATDWGHGPGDDGNVLSGGTAAAD